MSSQHLSGDGSVYNYHQPAQYNTSVQSGHDQPTSHTDTPIAAAPQREPETYGGESEPEGDADPQGPPKKKRRRQALSCTECKRRKIKCDRSQPCSPCTRRGEQAKCQWHIVEPIEKYVTRAEYDELKTRCDQLEAIVSQLFSAPPATMTIPSYQMGMHSAMPSAPPPGTVPYPSAPPVPVVYHPMMPPSTFPQHLETSHRYQRTESPHEVQSPRNQHSSQNSMQPPSSSPTVQTANPPNTLSRLRSPTGMKSPLSASKQQHSPLSLASITSPFHPESQSKNCHAQTLTLGERLRHGYLAQEDPADHFNDMVQGQQRQTRLIYTSRARLAHRHHFRSLQSHRDAIVIHPFFSPVSHHRGRTTGSV